MRTINAGRTLSTSMKEATPSSQRVTTSLVCWFSLTTTSFTENGLLALPLPTLLASSVRPSAFLLHKWLTCYPDDWNRESHPMKRDEYGVWEILVKAVNGQTAIPHNTKVKVGIRSSALLRGA